MSKIIAKNISKNLSRKYSQKPLDSVKEDRSRQTHLELSQKMNPKIRGSNG